MNQVLELRKLFNSNRIDSYIIPNNDEFNNEYLPASARRLEFITGFTGSAGAAVIGFSKAAFFTDGRYTLQAKQELDSKIFEVYNYVDKDPLEWLEENNLKAGFDPWLFNVKDGKRLAEKHRAIESNLVDQVWKSRPDAPGGPAIAHKLEYAGETSMEKRARVIANMQSEAALITTADSLNWLLNIRGSDTPNTPFCLCYAVLHKDGELELFINKRKLPAMVAASFENVKVRDIQEITSIGAELKISLDPTRTPFALYLALIANGAEILESKDPCQLQKAIKNAVEIEGIKKAHQLDGKALTKFLEWLSTQNQLDEIKAAGQLEYFRRENPEYKGPSFDTICGFGSNGAIVHYRSSEKTNKVFEQNNLVLVDSGGQYEFGTTDVTRTIAIGTPTEEMRRNYTLVLKGHIAIATAIFPKGTTGAQLDILARQYLWKAGLDYDHGTGHGVGHYLSVHEGPQSISKRGSDTPLRPGMVLSNEPGYYKNGEYGIRIENLVLVTEVARPQGQQILFPFEEEEAKKSAFLKFETLTLAPFDNNLIDENLLTTEEKSWIKAYYERISQNI